MRQPDDRFGHRNRQKLENSSVYCFFAPPLRPQAGKPRQVHHKQRQAVRPAFVMFYPITKAAVGSNRGFLYIILTVF